MKTTYQIVASTSLTDLTGVGEEILLDRVDGSILGRFWNGDFMTSSKLSLRLGSDAMDGVTLVIEIEQDQAA